MLGVVFLIEIVRCEDGRFDGFDVPCVEVFMGKEAEQFGIGFVGFAHIIRWQTVAVGEQGGAADVFQPTVEVVAQM